MESKANTDADRDRFMERVVRAESAWTLRDADGVAACESNDQESTVLLFWSDRADAERARASSFPEFELDELSLFDFLFRWLSGMADDGVLAGVNWPPDLVGQESEPDELEELLTAAMPKEMLEAYLERLKQALAEQGDEPDA